MAQARNEFRMQFRLGPSNKPGIAAVSLNTEYDVTALLYDA